jgi:hypothetical protein
VAGGLLPLRNLRELSEDLLTIGVSSIMSVLC